MATLRLEGIEKSFGRKKVLKDINLEVQRGERIIICGPSGSGKSTLIRCINRLEEHQRGKIIVDGIELTNDLKNIEKIRMEVGMVFQHFNLFPHLTILENLSIGPIWVRKTPRKEAEETAMYYLEKVHIAEQAKKFPGQLSGGQQQRVAIARAFANQPAIILADEPTGEVDEANSKMIYQIFKDLNTELNLTTLIVSHDVGLARHVDRVIAIRDGKIATETVRKSGARQTRIETSPGWRSRLEAIPRSSSAMRKRAIEAPKCRRASSRARSSGTSAAPSRAPSGTGPVMTTRW